MHTSGSPAFFFSENELVVTSLERVGGCIIRMFLSRMWSKLNEMDRFFFSKVNIESWGVLEYAGVNVSKLCCICSRMFIHFDVGMVVE